MSKKESIWLQGLWVYHFGFAFVFYYYIQQQGGDALRYWALEAEGVENPGHWMGYWGQRTHFVQWLNYIPAKVLGLSFLSGNVMYAAFSFLGIREVDFWMLQMKGTKSWMSWSLMGIFFLPNLHFWSAGVGKEALLLVGLVWALKGFVSLKDHWKVAVLGVLLSFWVRPLQGVVLGGMLGIYFLGQKVIPVKVRLGVGLGMAVLMGLGVWRLLQYMHLEALSFQGLMAFSSGQMDFLKGFGAGSEIPMETYHVFEKGFALFFRPFWGEVDGFWQVAAALENSVGLLLVLGLLAVLPFYFVKKIKFTIPPFLWAGLVFGLVMAVAFAFTLNNLGIIMRMKSTYMLFVYLFYWVGVWGRMERMKEKG
ncbi:hypothetical protein [Aquiflexum lacus]|uniref:hypothetical protein n=1 Tax=Aquiflexum lacus TaxID=2483805 RepID=UPI0018931134|nr:hypothetical protein [Aquiflexum lacus]